MASSATCSVNGTGFAMARILLLDRRLSCHDRFGAGRNDRRLAWGTVAATSGLNDGDHVLHSLPARSLPARRVSRVRRSLGARHPALRWRPDRLFPAARGHERRRLGIDRLREPGRLRALPRGAARRSRGPRQLRARRRRALHRSRGAHLARGRRGDAPPRVGRGGGAVRAPRADPYEPRLARVAAMVADPARSRMLSYLLGGEFASAGELAAAASVTPATASGHLAKLSDARFVVCEPRGRHHYYRLADAEIAHALEALALVAERDVHERAWAHPARQRLRYARCCYGHLAGRLGVAVYDALRAEHGLTAAADGFSLSDGDRKS